MWRQRAARRSRTDEPTPGFKMPIEDFLDQTLSRLEQFYAELGPAAGTVRYCDIGPHRQFRHVALTDSLACYLKASRYTEVS